MRRMDDDGLRLTITLALVLTIYRLAHAFDVSGPIAVVVSGLVIVSMLPTLRGDDDRRSVIVEFWGLLDELLNAMLFVLIGFQISEVQISQLALAPTLMAVPLAILSRLASIAIPALSIGGSWRDRYRRVVALTWAGMRGGISVALALTLPATPHREQLLTICYVVVVFSIIGQGTTMPRLMRALYRGAS
jgi:monovalent cation:H+ antiporter, CPA1 family